MLRYLPVDFRSLHAARMDPWFLPKMTTATRANDPKKVGVKRNVAEVAMKRAKRNRAMDEERILR